MEKESRVFSYRCPRSRIRSCPFESSESPITGPFSGHFAGFSGQPRGASNNGSAAHRADSIVPLSGQKGVGSAGYEEEP